MKIWIPVDAHAPIKDGTIVSYYCVLLWMEKKTIKKTQRVDEDFFDNVEKTLRFDTKIDTCRDLTANIVEGKRYVRRSLMASNILM